MKRKIKLLIQQKQGAYRKSRRTGKSDMDKIQEAPIRSSAPDQEITQGIHVRSSQRKLQREPKHHWSCIKSAHQEASGVSPIKNEDGFLKSDRNPSLFRTLKGI